MRYQHLILYMSLIYLEFQANPPGISVDDDLNAKVVSTSDFLQIGVDILPANVVASVIVMCAHQCSAYSIYDSSSI